ncbi:methyltransferase [candidate division KSB1 bacterium]|nr:methyltransferase [candidate division KSB1 bacterium]
MNSKQRAQTAIKHVQPDRVPVHIWFTPQVAASLADRFGASGIGLDVAVGNDILMTHIGVNRGFDPDVPAGTFYLDEWGIGYRKVHFYNEVVENPLANIDSLKDYKFPLPANPERFRILDQILATYGDTHFIAADMSSNLFEICFHLRGMERFLSDLAFNHPIVDELIRRLLEFDVEVAELTLERTVDMIWLGSDVASQQSMIISPQQWRKIFKPAMAQLIAAIKTRRPGIPVAYHSCGAIREIILDLIEIGIDVLNPIQPLVPGMEPAGLKRDFGDRLTFHGGLDVQQVMPYGTPGDVRDAIRELLSIMMPGGGYVFSPAHALQPDVPLENIGAMLDAVKEFGEY